jgi:magnesium transporter
MITHYHSSARARKLSTLDKPKVGSWTHVVEPSEAELDALADQFNLNRDLLSDAVDIYEAPRLEVDDGVVYVFTRYSHPAGKEISTEPILIAYTSDSLVTIMRSKDDVLSRILDDKVEVLTTQKTKTFLVILEQINRSYKLQLSQAGRRILQFRAKLRKSELTNAEFVSFIDLEEDLNEFLTALQPQAGVLTSLRTGRYMKLYEDDKDLIEDLTLGTNELIELTKSRLRTIVNFRQAYDTIVTKNLNSVFRRLTSIGIFLTVPMVIGGLWGMNVSVPFSDGQYTFVTLLGLSVVIIAGLFFYFKKRRWF